MTTKKTTVKKFTPYLILVRGKHVNDHYLVDRPERIDDVCLDILKDWSYCGMLEKYERRKTTLESFVKAKTNKTIKQLQDLAKAIGDVPVKLNPYGPTESVEKTLKSLENDFNLMQYHDNMVDKAKEAIKKKDKKIAKQLVDFFSGGEYMKVERISFANRGE